MVDRPNFTLSTHFWRARAIVDIIRYILSPQGASAQPNVLFFHTLKEHGGGMRLVVAQLVGLRVARLG